MKAPLPLALSLLVALGLLPALGAAQEPAVVEPLSASGSRFPASGSASLQVLGWEGDANTAEVLIENRGSQPLPQATVAWQRSDGEGRVRSLHTRRTELKLAPGMSTIVRLSVPSVPLEPGESWQLRLIERSLFKQRDPETALDALREAVEVPSRDQQEVLDRLTALRREVAPAPDHMINLQGCFVFCADCARIAAVICREGVDELSCRCDIGQCNISCS